MRVYLGSDHAGFELKGVLLAHLNAGGRDAVDVGPAAFDADDDYPSFCIDTGVRVTENPGSLGIVIGGSGNGEQIAANKVSGIRAALAWKPELAVLAREHNDANIVSLGARMHTEDEAKAIVDAFLATEFSGADRHLRRIEQIADFEKTRIPPKSA